MTERTDFPEHSPKAPTGISAGIFRHGDGVIPNLLAIGYAFGAYFLGLFLLSRSGIAFVGGIFLLAHSLVIAGYLIHECTHGTLFAPGKPGGRDLHRMLGTALGWLTGACYGSLEKISDKHLRHHFDRADIVAVDYRAILANNPRLRKIVEAGQWLCLPAVEILMHTLVMLNPFLRDGNPREKRPVVLVVVIRTLFFTVLGMAAGWKFLAGYAIAYLMFLSVLGFMDAFQHQYLLLEGLDAERRDSPTRDRSRFAEGYFSRDYEDDHTFSNLLSERWPVFNLLVLNFTYHNVHHHQPREPWHRLPRLHRESSGKITVVPFHRQLKDFFRYRVARVMAPATDHLEASNVGAAGVSFLTAL